MLIGPEVDISRMSYISYYSSNLSSLSWPKETRISNHDRGKYIILKREDMVGI